MVLNGTRNKKHNPWKSKFDRSMPDGNIMTLSGLILKGILIPLYLSLSGIIRKLFMGFFVGCGTVCSINEYSMIKEGEDK